MNDEFDSNCIPEIKRPTLLMFIPYLLNSNFKIIAASESTIINLWSPSLVAHHACVCVRCHFLCRSPLLQLSSGAVPFGSQPKLLL